MPIFQLLQDIYQHPANQGRRAYALTRSVRWQLRKRFFGAHWDIDYHGLTLRCHAGNHSAPRAIYFSGFPDFWEMKFIADYLRPGDSVIDAGANIGLYAVLMCAYIGHTGSLDAFEPNSKVCVQLRENVELNNINNAQIYELGLSAKSGSANMVDTGDNCTGRIINDEDDRQFTTITTTRLDETLTNKPYEFAKFDIEGHEPLALEGADSWLADGNPAVMLIEMAGYSERSGISTTEFIDRLESQSYKSFIYSPDSKTLLPCREPWRVPVQNVLAIADSKYDFVKARLV